MATVRLFEYTVHAHLYSKYRPTYPRAVISAITNYVTKFSGSLCSSVDVACGSGQSTFYLRDTFKQVTGVDISKAQIERANSKCKAENIDNVTFRVANGMELPFENESIDVVTIAQAVHWLDTNKFFAECKRVLKNKGCLAVYGYGNVHIVNERCNALISNFYRNSLKGCWHKARYHIDNEYRSIELPFSNTHRIDLTMPYETSLEAFIGYLSTWSGYQKYCEAHRDNTLLKELSVSMKEILESSKPKESFTGKVDSTVQMEQETENRYTKVEAYFPLFILLGQKLVD